MRERALLRAHRRGCGHAWVDMCECVRDIERWDEGDRPDEARGKRSEGGGARVRAEQV